MNRWASLLLCIILLHVGPARTWALETVPDKLVVLTFDDSVASHYSVVRPLLKRYGFGATFFITEGFSFRTNKQDYMTWEQIKELHQDGFEIGNHTRDHLGISARTLGQLREQVEAINARCAEYGIPQPVSFAYPGNAITPGAIPILKELGIRFARRGGAPEHPYEWGRGFAYEPGADHPLLIPSAGDARPDWTLDDFKRAADQARRAHRGAAISRRAGPRTSVGAHAARAFRGVHALSAHERFQSDRAARSGAIRRSEPGAGRSAGDCRKAEERTCKEVLAEGEILDKAWHTACPPVSTFAGRRLVALSGSPVLAWFRDSLRATKLATRTRSKGTSPLRRTLSASNLPPGRYHFLTVEHGEGILSRNA